MYYSTYDTVYQVAGLDGSQLVSSVAVGSQPYFDPSSSATLDTSYSFSQHELGPDGRIYIPLSRHTYPNSVYDPRNMSLCTIDSPDVQGVGCSFQLNSFYLEGKRSSWGLLNMPNYNLGALVGSGCDTLTSTVSVSTPSFTWSVYPNPTTKAFQISASGVTLEATIEILNPLGQVVFHRVASPQNNSIHQAVDVSNFPNGVYIVLLKAENGSFAQKVVVNR